MKPHHLLLALAAAALVTAGHAATGAVKALLITGGCCHDYAFQANALEDGVAKFGKVDWTIINEGGSSKNAKIPLYDNPDWARSFDVIVHNECFADLDDPAYVRRITAAHRAGKPALVIHCAMHSYRLLQDNDWREFLGVTSRRHDEGKARYPVRVLAADHPIMREFPAAWTTPMDELYVIEKLWPSAHALASARSEKDGHDYPVVWINDYHGTRVAGTTFGHDNATWRDPVYIGLVARALFWAAGRTQ